jgi:hypothetical protein
MVPGRDAGRGREAGLHLCGSRHLGAGFDGDDRPAAKTIKLDGGGIVNRIA